MLRLAHYFPANRIIHRSLSTGPVSRTIRVEPLPEGYNVNRILAAIKANPAESITVAQDHLLVRFFNEDMARQCIVSGSGMVGAVMKMDDALSPPLSAVDVAALGRLGMSRSLALTDIPKEVQEGNVLEILSRHGVLQSWIFDLPNRTATARYLDMHQAFKAWVDLRENGINVSFRMNPDRYIFPGWFPAEEADQGKVKCRVKISRISHPTFVLTLRSWISEFEKDQGPVLSTALLKEQGSAMLQFATSRLAQRFVDMWASEILRLRVRLSVEPLPLAIPRTLVTAIALGASRTVTINIDAGKDVTLSRDYLHFFKRIGTITSESRYQFTSPIHELRVSYETVFSAMRCVLVLAGLEVVGNKRPRLPGLEGASINFLGSYLNSTLVSPSLWQ
ncbi:uncharacterized protein BT62DRAFT_925956 [Guyanagaster necrorhizus]|uniref:Uncharacterized protein n=1 Tax=Guyanagaster necrorhizus TaxID=856835 RepID=A0A9P8AXG9_9AGAR|nr:uncharacterized protein BT62DRAFT_925956 [Guyanagaster necrorhizus MCA 3950]KAG7451774.1 hypothetical protein BT62DRAFT_925956 [Guyanagaster necrorhizus MCA 3950]